MIAYPVNPKDSLPELIVCAANKDPDTQVVYPCVRHGCDIFWGLIKMGVSDIYITEDLGFNLIAIKPLAEKENMDQKDRENLILKFATEFRRMVKTYADVDTHELYNK